MERRKLKIEDIDKVRNYEGFPIAKDEEIMSLSDAPYYTMCPNPFIKDFIEEKGIQFDEYTDNYHKEPFAADVSEGKSDPIYNAHSYHTKVPYKAIMRYILHYTDPGDIVLDSFCGTGMTGVAAQMCEGIDPITTYTFNKLIPNCKWGSRRAILGDLSPMATFIAKNFNKKGDIVQFSNDVEQLMACIKEECMWMYRTHHTKEVQLQLNLDEPCGIINYVVWSDVFICPHCGNEIVFWDAALNPKTRAVEDRFSCTTCGVKLRKPDCAHAMHTVYDEALKSTVTMLKQVPVLINYTYNGKRYEKKPDKYDTDLINRIDSEPIKSWFPADRMPLGTESRRNDKYGITHVHQFFTKRTLRILSLLWEKTSEYTDADLLKLSLTGIMQISSKQSAFRYDSRNTNNTAGGILKGTLYIPSISREGNVFSNLERRVSAIQSMIKEQSSFNGDSNVLISVASACKTNIPDNSVDYIFTDPPFGSNINYSELSFMWEAWLGVKTNSLSEAIINTAQNKSLVEYQSLMRESFIEYYRVLKPNRWITVEFHNSKNAVWNAIQEALQSAGFIIADVRILDKKQGSFKQVNNTSAVKQDLVISAYKPTNKFRKEFLSEAGTKETAWAFVRQHLQNIPVIVVKNGKIEVIDERQAYLLFDRMIAYHIMQGIPVPIDAPEFYRGLDERFLKRDGMYFLPDQVNEYDTARIINDVEPIQLSFVVSNEKTAISWLFQQLNTPQTYAAIQPKFMQEVKTVDRHEKIPELSVLLEENFLKDDEGRWYVPDVTKESDIIKLREKNLLKEFEGYLSTRGKLKLFRAEAIRVGFAKLWKDKNYKLIVETAERLPEQVVQEDDKLLMYYDISLSRI